MHSLLRRQLKKAFGESFSVPPEWKGFTEMVDTAYHESDTDRNMLERSLELSSQELSEMNSEMRAIFEAIPDLLFRVDREGIILNCKTGNTSDLIFNRERLINRKIDDIPVPSVSRQFADAMDTVRKTKSPASAEYSLYIEGNEQFYEARFIPCAKDQIVIMVRNVTDRRRAEKALMESEEKYRSIFENSIEGIFQTTRDGKYAAANPALVRMLGYGSQEEILHEPGAVTRHYVVPDDRKRFRELIERYDVLQGFETQVYRRDGSRIWISINAHVVRDRKGDIAFYEGTVENITDRRRAEEALFESEEKYRSIVEGSHVGVYIIEDGLFRFVNATLCDILGYTYGEIVNTMGPGDIVLAEDFPAVGESLEKRLSGEIKTAELTHRIRRKDGEIRNVKAIGSAILYRGRPAVIGTLLDITKEKELEAQLLQAQKLETVGRLAGGIAHDFNNMLGVILGNVQMAKINLSASEHTYEFCDAIEKATTKAADLVRQLLAFSRRQLLELRTLDLNDLIAGFEKMIHRVIAEDIDMTFVLANDLPAIKADETQMNQVLLNLVVNARDAMADGGILTISTGMMDVEARYVQTHPDVQPGRYVMLSVADTGIGMERDVSDRMFEPFFTTKPGGSGLGLSVVYGIVKQHGGFVEVVSERGRGTTIRVFLPRAEEAVIPTAAPEMPVERGNETILIVEDDEDFRKVEAEMLTRLGYRVYAAADGMEGVTLFTEKSEEIDLVILDVVMPRMSGRDALEGMRRVRPDVPSLFVTGYSLNGIHVNYILDKDIEALQKPFSFDTLSRKIREVMQKAGSGRR
jgi:PAS domain S-box-containing protein